MSTGSATEKAWTERKHAKRHAGSNVTIYCATACKFIAACIFFNLLCLNYFSRHRAAGAYYKQLTDAAVDFEVDWGFSHEFLQSDIRLGRESYAGWMVAEG